MRYAFVALMCVFAGLYANSKRGGSFASRLAFKAIASVSFVMIAFLGRIGADKTYYALIMIGLCFSLAGDVLLVIPDRRAAAAGGAAFLFAHFSYIAAFFVYAKPTWFDAVVFVVFAAAGLIVFGKRLSRLEKRVPPVIIYGLALCAMAAKAISMLSADSVDPTLAAFAALGGVLFVLSDALLAHAHFHQDDQGAAGALSVLVYYASQALIALSISI